MSLFDSQLKEKKASKNHDETQEPPMYKVLLLNDDYTTMEFVIEILLHVFKKPIEAATRIMLQVHREGIGLCGIYPYEIAETKISIVQSAAREHGFPLQCIMEEE